MKSTKFILLFSILVTSFSAFAMIDPYYKEVMQRGYTTNGDSVVFPDGSTCSIADFNEGICGQQWMTKDYCIPEGGPVWDEDKCCVGLQAYLPEGMAGQATCVAIEKSAEQQSELGEYERPLFYFFLGLVLIFTIFILYSIFVKYKKRP